MLILKCEIFQTATSCIQYFCKLGNYFLILLHRPHKEIILGIPFKTLSRFGKGGISPHEGGCLSTFQIPLETH